MKTLRAEDKKDLRKPRYKDSYQIYYYSGNFDMNKYYIKTCLVALAEVLLVVLGTVLMLLWGNSTPLILALLIFTVSLIWYIVCHAPYISALYSVFVLDEDKSLWYIKVMPGRHYAGPNGSVPDVGGATKLSQDRAYIVQAIEDIKAGKKRHDTRSGGYRYTKLVNYELKGENDKFIYVEAIATSHKYKSEKKIFKFVKQYDGIMELISSIENE